MAQGGHYGKEVYAERGGDLRRDNIQGRGVIIYLDHCQHPLVSLSNPNLRSVRGLVLTDFGRSYSQPNPAFYCHLEDLIWATILLHCLEILFC